jgi:hypothetical protein
MEFSTFAESHFLHPSFRRGGSVLAYFLQERGGFLLQTLTSMGYTPMGYSRFHFDFGAPLGAPPVLLAQPTGGVGRLFFG